SLPPNLTLFPYTTLFRSRDLRKARRLTQARVAKRLGITQDSVSRLENAAICCSRRYEKRSKRWAATCVLLLNSRIVRRSWCLNYPRTNRPANRLGDMRTLSLKIPFALATVKGRPACAAPFGRCGPQKLRQTSKSTSYSESA